MGAFMAHQVVVSGHALVSPSRRTRETWDGLAGALPGGIPFTRDRLYYATPEVIVIEDAPARYAR